MGIAGGNYVLRSRIPDKTVRMLIVLSLMVMPSYMRWYNASGGCLIFNSDTRKLNIGIKSAERLCLARDQ
jgi:hypothetical protein